VAEIRVVTVSELQWDFDHHGAISMPRMMTAGGYSVRVDPTPAYAHEEAEVWAAIRKPVAVCPPLSDVSFYLLSFEDVARTNGSTTMHPIYKNGKRESFTIDITLSGKRIPIHPGMTRYLVAHEYAHGVEDWLNALHPNEQGHDGSMRNEYAELRGLPATSYYGPGQWHVSWGEIFANDWRILVADVEPEFWPHKTTTHPLRVPNVNKLVEWWTQKMDELRDARAAEIAKANTPAPTEEETKKAA
jgi:hypothetical protein